MTAADSSRKAGPEGDDSGCGARHLPEPLLQKLEEAAGLYSLTELERHLAEMETLGAEEQRLAAHLRALSDQYDMDRILIILKEIGHV